MGRLFLFSWLLLPAAGCLNAPPTPDRDRIVVGVSVPPLAYLVETVGGSAVEAVSLLSEGSSPHAFEPSARRVAALAGARLLVRVGHPALGFERVYFDPLLESRPDIRSVSLTEVARALPRSRANPDSGALDPHLWLSPLLMQHGAYAVGAALAELDPRGAAGYRERARRTALQIEALDRDLAARLAALSGRRFLVFHPAWGHFAAAYGLAQVAIEEEGKEPSPRRLAALLREARNEGYRTIFVQKGISDRSARALSRELGAEVVTLDPLGLDWPATLRETAEAIARSLS